MKVHTFVAKVGVESVRQMDETINGWMRENQISPKFITQTIGAEGERQGHGRDPILITSVWYE